MHGPLTASDLFPAGPLRRLGRRVELFSELDSTNAYLLGHAGELEDGTVAVAEFQSAGRGRQGRRWLAPRGSAILLSVLLIESANSTRIAQATSLAALASAEAIEAETACRPALRWPNDLVVEGRKLGGVLAESTQLRGPGQLRRALVIGVGLNCFQQRGHLGADLAKTASSLEIECPEPINRPALARRLIERLDTHFSGEPATQDDLRWVHQAWTARCADLGAWVTLEEDSRRYTGTVLEIADNGDLIVQLDTGGRRRFESATTTRTR
jgi:BirA family biotin operon repressor/biotin-[acetyl-CoA-carboxylase] ligase